MQDKAQELLNHTHNQYELVLNVARRATTIKDDPRFRKLTQTSP